MVRIYWFFALAGSSWPGCFDCLGLIEVIGGGRTDLDTNFIDSANPMGARGIK